MNNETLSLDRIDLKLFLDDSVEVDWERCVQIFTEWLKADADEEEWLDIADYTHMPQGPGVIVVGPEKHVSIDDRRGELGLLYSRREPFSGTNVERLQQLVSETARYRMPAGRGGHRRQDQNGPARVRRQRPPRLPERRGNGSRAGGGHPRGFGGRGRSLL